MIINTNSPKGIAILFQNASDIASIVSITVTGNATGKSVLTSADQGYQFPLRPQPAYPIALSWPPPKWNDPNGSSGAAPLPSWNIPMPGQNLGNVWFYITPTYTVGTKKVLCPFTSLTNDMGSGMQSFIFTAPDGGQTQIVIQVISGGGGGPQGNNGPLAGWHGNIQVPDWFKKLMAQFLLNEEKELKPAPRGPVKKKRKKEK